MNRRRASPNASNKPRRSSKKSVKLAPKHRPGPPHVALVVETSTTFGRQVLCGIARYIRENSPWSVYFSERSVYDSCPSWLKRWSGNGVISRAFSPEVVETAIKLGIPVIDLNEQIRGQGVPLVSNDHGAIGRLAAKHLLERGFTRFGFVGHAGAFWSEGRFKGFAEVIREAGYACVEYHGKKADLRAMRQRLWELELDEVAGWIDNLPKPVGVMASDDFRAVQFLAACRIADVAVPEQVAVIGVGGDDVSCELAIPPLSSIILNPQRMGYKAAELLDRLMRGESVGAKEVLISPLDVITRQSTDVTAIVDPVVAKAMRFIRERACDGINVNDVLEHVLVSRTALQHHFRDALDQSIHDVIVGMRLTRAKELLSQSKLSLQDIAERSGFNHTEYLSSVFKQRTGWTPAKYREQYGYTTVKPFQVVNSMPRS
jgi:LacI family transcriptional regulator